MKDNRIKILKILFGIVLVLLVIGHVQFSSKAEGDIDKLSYRIIDNKEVQITGVDSRVTSIVIPSEIKGYPVRRIGDWAFSDSSLTSVTIPESVNWISKYAFSGCDNLCVTVTYPFSFSDRYIENVDINVIVSDSVTRIGSGAFKNKRIRNIIIPNSVTSIGDDAFYGCYKLNDFTLPNSLRTIGKYAFYGCSIHNISIPNSVTRIDDYAFGNCRSLNIKSIPDSIIHLGDGAFSGTGLTSVKIPKSIQNIREKTFYNCYNLTSVIIPDSVVTIGNEAFYNCESLDALYIPPSISYTSIGRSIVSNYTTIMGYYNSGAREYAIRNELRFVEYEPKDEGGKDSGQGSNNSDRSTTPKYSNEWINGKWYDANGSQTYPGTLQWRNNATGWWVEDTSGWYPTNKWQKIDGIWYFFKPDGYMASNEYYNGYWFNSDGSWDDKYLLSWKSNSTGWWVEDISGWWPQSSWLKIDGYWYYFDASGYMVTSQYVDGWWIDSDGVCR
ncbi:MAG: leucine-rich repeat protein [Eubacterium sp.]|nr:leucine-rich repeat protein [Eubacterium sp.]